MINCIKCRGINLEWIPLTAPIGVCDKCWMNGATQAAKNHILACDQGCQNRGGSLIAGCDRGLKLLDAYFDSIATR